MRQNALDQPNCRIFEPTLSPGENDEKIWAFACWCKLIENKNWLKYIEVGVVINGCTHSCHRTLKLAKSREEINGINWFMMCWYKFRKSRSYLNNFWVVVVKNGCSLLGDRTLKSAISQEWIDEMSWFFASWYKCRKANCSFNNYWVGRLKNDQEVLKSSVFWLIEWFLHADRS